MNDEKRFGHLELEENRGGPARAERAFDDREYTERARELEWSGDHEAALRLYARALGHNPHNEGAWVGQLRCLVAAEDYREAMVWADKAAEYLPRSGPVRAWRAVALARDGRDTEALRASDEALKLGSSPEVWLSRAWVNGADRPEPADRCVQKAMEQGDRDPGLVLGVAVFYIHVGRFSQALQTLQKLTAQRPGLAHPWYLLGRCFGELGMKEQALQALEEACGKAPTRRPTREARARLQGQSGLATLWKRLFRR